MFLKQSASCAKLRIFEAVLRLGKKEGSKIVTPSQYQSQLKVLNFYSHLSCEI